MAERRLGRLADVAGALSGALAWLSPGAGLWLTCRGPVLCSADEHDEEEEPGEEEAMEGEVERDQQKARAQSHWYPAKAKQLN